MILPDCYRIVSRNPADDAKLTEIENRAGQLFRPWFPQIADGPPSDIASVRDLFSGRDVWVATTGNGPAGFIVAGVLGPFLHIYELSVDPAHGRKGVGSSLVGHIVQDAALRGLRGVSLTTFRDVPFNAPFYARLGFAESDHPLLVARRVLETPPGVDPAGRVALLRPL